DALRPHLHQDGHGREAVTSSKRPLAIGDSRLALDALPIPSGGGSGRGLPCPVKPIFTLEEAARSCSGCCPSSSSSLPMCSDRIHVCRRIPTTSSFPPPSGRGSGRGLPWPV